MGGKFYGKSEFNPRLITTQIIVMQSAFYVCFVLTTSAIDYATGEPPSFSQFFRYRAYNWNTTSGVALAASLFITGLIMAALLAQVVERAKKCLDFVVTYHIFHLLFTWNMFGFPSTYQWWVINVASATAATLLGEYMCMMSETAAIKLPPKKEKVKKKIVMPMVTV